jgi:hypothetical protein
VEVDSTFYRCPTTEAVHNWALKTPPGFIFSLKVPQTNMRFLARANELYTSVSLLESTNHPENLTNLLLIAAGLGEGEVDLATTQTGSESADLSPCDIERRIGLVGQCAASRHLDSTMQFVMIGHSVAPESTFRP